MGYLSPQPESTGTYSTLYSNSHIGGYIIVSVSCSDIDCGSWMRLTALNIGSMDRGSGLYKIGQN